MSLASAGHSRLAQRPAETLILSRVRYERANDPNVSTTDSLAIKHHDVRAQRCCAPAWQHANFNLDPFLILVRPI